MDAVLVTQQSSPHKLGWYLAVAAVLQIVWGLTPTASKFVIDEIPVELYIALRWTISSVVFWIYILATRSWKPIGVSDYGKISLLGIVGYGVGSLGTLYGLKLGGVANFALMASTSPIISALFSILLLKERPHKRFHVALPISVLGLVIVVLGKYETSSSNIALASAGLILGAYVCEALVFVNSKRFKITVGVPQYLAIAQLATAAGMWIMQLFYYRQTSLVSLISTVGLEALIFVSVVSCVLCFAILYWLLTHVEGHKLALFDGVHTISAVFFGYLFFREKLSFSMIFGGAMVLFAIAYGHFPSRKPKQNTN